MNEKLDLEHEFPGEPRLGIDFDQLTTVGARQVRRRRNGAVIGAASVAVVIIVGASVLVPRLRDAAGYGGIPGCESVLGPTNSNKAQSTSSASVSTAPSPSQAGPVVEPSPIPGYELPTSLAITYEPTDVAQTSAYPAQTAVMSDGESQSGAAMSSTNPLPASEADAIAQAQSDAAIAAAGQPIVHVGDSVPLDPVKAPDALTSSYWKLLSSWGVVTASDSSYGLPIFQRNSETASPNEVGWEISADTFAVSQLGEGELSIWATYDNQAVPSCHEGELDRRVTYPDGTVVDLSFGTVTYGDSDGAVQEVQKFHAVAFHPDGTTVIVTASNWLTKFMTAVPGVEPSPPITVDQVQQLASESMFTRSSALAGAVTAVIEDQTPDLLGLSAEEAEAATIKVGLVQVVPALTQVVTVPALEGKVVGQSPGPGTQADKGVPIQLVFGVAPPTEESLSSDATEQITVVQTTG